MLANVFSQEPAVFMAALQRMGQAARRPEDLLPLLRTLQHLWLEIKYADEHHSATIGRLLQVRPGRQPSCAGRAAATASCAGARGLAHPAHAPRAPGCPHLRPQLTADMYAAHKESLSPAMDEALRNGLWTLASCACVYSAQPAVVPQLAQLLRCSYPRLQARCAELLGSWMTYSALPHQAEMFEAATAALRQEDLPLKTMEAVCGLLKKFPLSAGPVRALCLRPAAAACLAAPLAALRWLAPALAPAAWRAGQLVRRWGYLGVLRQRTCGAAVSRLSAGLRPARAQVGVQTRWTRPFQEAGVVARLAAAWHQQLQQPSALAASRGVQQVAACLNTFDANARVVGQMHDAGVFQLVVAALRHRDFRRLRLYLLDDEDAGAPAFLPTACLPAGLLLRARSARERRRPAPRALAPTPPAIPPAAQRTARTRRTRRRRARSARRCSART